MATESEVNVMPPALKELIDKKLIISNIDNNNDFLSKLSIKRVFLRNTDMKYIYYIVEGKLAFDCKEEKFENKDGKSTQQLTTKKKKYSLPLYLDDEDVENVEKLQTNILELLDEKKTDIEHYDDDEDVSS